MVRFLLALIILAGGGGISFYWLTHKPTAQRRPSQVQARLVEVTRVRSGTQKVAVQAMGTVVPARKIQLASRVSGEIIEVNPEFVPGGHFKANQRMLQIEPKDYQLAVEQFTSNLAKAQCDLKVEMGQQSVAQREYELLGQDVQEEDKELLLREPQMAMTQAAVTAAQASLEQAQLNLKRTNVMAPFNAIVQSRNVDLGSQVNVSTALASLVDTDKYWIQVSVPVDELRWITIPDRNGDEGSLVRVYYESAWGPDAFRMGTVERLMTDLEPQGRMARLLVAVADPLELNSDSQNHHSLILESYVRVKIQGPDLADVVRIPRTALRDGNRVWVMQPDNTLDIREVTIIWGGNDHVCVTDGLADGDLLIISDLAAPVQGMALRTADSFKQHLTQRPDERPAQKNKGDISNDR
ncbi:MAG: efflux RND transporter periplasmic adaptor subunit [Anaerolineales bacterium]